MTKKRPAKRIASNGPRLPGQPTKKTVKARARARARKQEAPVVSAEDVKAAIEYPPSAEMVAYLEANMKALIGLAPECPYPIVLTEDEVKDKAEAFGVHLEYDSIDMVGQQAVAQPVDLPVQAMPAFDVPAVTRRELRLNPPNLSPKQQRAKRRLEDGFGWRCLNCYRVLSPKLSGCPFCNTRKTRP